MASNVLLKLKIREINIFKADGSDKLNLAPQFVEIVMYQSIYNPLLTATMTINDPISLLTKYPLLGEETIEITYEPTDEIDSAIYTVTQAFKWKFMINSIQAIKADQTNRVQMYILKLWSVEMRQNARKNLMIAYNDQYDSTIKKILTNELLVDPAEKMKFQDRIFEQSKGVHHVVIPNLSPLEAINWIKMRAVPQNPDHSLYFFYETNNGFNFRTAEDMLETNWNERIPQKYIFVSNNNERIRQSLAKFYNINEHYMFTSMQINKRWDTLEKISLGYFENEFMDIDIYNKRAWSYPDKLDPMKQMKDINGKVFNMNSANFIKNMQTENTLPGSLTRVRYATSLNQGDQIDDDNFFRNKWGKAVRQQAALGQVDITIVVPGDTRLNAGDLIQIFIPEFHGFTDTMKDDKYLAGIYLITDVKHVVTFGMHHTTTLSINRNSYQESLAQVPKMEYGAS
jgi:hypothetical protein